MDAIATLLTALLAAPKQNDRLLRLHTAAGPDVLVPETLAGFESLDQGGFRLELTALSVDAHLSLDALLGQPALLQLLTDAPMTAQSLSALRPFHGHVTAFELLGSNGGMARYRMVLEPWLTVLRQRVDSYVFHDMSVIQIAEDLFADYMPNSSGEAGALIPAWRWELADASVYRKRSITTQYEESDFAFLERLLAEEGIAYWFEHAGTPDSDSLGSHTLILGDHGEAFVDGGEIRFHRSDVTERSDSIQQWSAARCWQTGVLHRASWDYRSVSQRPVTAEAASQNEVVAEDRDTSGPYGYVDSAHGELRIQRQLEALQVSAQAFDGTGTWREQAPGQRFTLTQHDGFGDANNQFNCLRVEHSAHNNLGAEVFEALEQTLGAVVAANTDLPPVFAGLTQKPLSFREKGWGEATATGEAASAQASAKNKTTTATAPADFYQNSIIALPADVPYRPRTHDGHGLRLHPKPTVTGTQSAIVVTDGAPVQTDRDHRIKVQFLWQRGSDASSGRAHPSGDDNAPATDAAWTWVRVATPWAGDNWGGVVLPRKGQEVLVAFMEGDIDRPVIVGALYNGRGQIDAPHNQIHGGGAGATGNAAAWFEGNEHPAIFTGLKSQALADSQSGSGGYQLLRLDDTPAEGRTQVATTQHASTLTLGHLKGGQDNVRGGDRGFGVELATAASGAIRAGAGLLLTTQTGRQQLESSTLPAQLQASAQLLQSLCEAAITQTAVLPDDPESLPVQDSLLDVQTILTATKTGGPAGEGVGGGEGEAPAWSAPLLVGNSPEGLIATTAADQIWLSGTQTALIAGNDLNWMSQGELVTAVAGGLLLYTQGSEPPADKPQQLRGIALHAAQGRVSARAHQNLASVAALTSVTLASVEADVSVAASTHVLATAAGAWFKLEGGDIELGAPGTIEFKASKKVWTGPGSISPVLPALPRAEWALLDSLRFAIEGSDKLVEQMDWIDKPFSIFDHAGATLASGTFSRNGRQPRVMSERAGELRLVVGEDSWRMVEAQSGVDDEAGVDGDTEPQFDAPVADDPYASALADDYGSAMPAGASATEVTLSDGARPIVNQTVIVKRGGETTQVQTDAFGRLPPFVASSSGGQVTLQIQRGQDEPKTIAEFTLQNQSRALVLFCSLEEHKSSLANHNPQPANKAKARDTIRYVVQPDDTIEKIAKLFETDTSDLVVEGSSEPV